MRISEPFKTQGGHTQFDNDVLDHIMPTLKPSEWMVLCFIIRKTKGWHKDSDGIAYSQFIKGTGINSNSTIKKCLDSLVGKDLILIGTTGHKADCHHYMLNKSYSFRITETVERPVTFSVERPVTETVDTKESPKEIERKPAPPEITIYENNFGPVSSLIQSQAIQDDYAHFGDESFREAVTAAKISGKPYRWAVGRMKGKANDSKQASKGDAAWAEIVERLSTGKWNGLSEQTLQAVRKCGGASAFKAANEKYDIPRLKKQVYSYVQ